MIISVSVHAIDRYVERVGGDRAQALAALSGAAIHYAAGFGARIVRIGRHRAVLEFTPDGVTVVTVVPTDRLPCQLIPIAWGGMPFVAVDPDFLQHHGGRHGQ